MWFGEPPLLMRLVLVHTIKKKIKIKKWKIRKRERETSAGIRGTVKYVWDKVGCLSLVFFPPLASYLHFDHHFLQKLEQKWKGLLQFSFLKAMLASTALNLGSLGGQLLSAPTTRNPLKPPLLPPTKSFFTSSNSICIRRWNLTTSVKTAVAAAAVDSSDPTQKVRHFQFLYNFASPLRIAISLFSV